MEAKVRKGRLVIVLPLEEPRQSASGKTLVVASSHGVKKTASRVNGKILCVVANAFVYPEAEGAEQESSAKKRQGR